MSHEFGSLDQSMTSSSKPQNITHSWRHQPKTPSLFF